MEKKQSIISFIIINFTFLTFFIPNLIAKTLENYTPSVMHCFVLLTCGGGTDVVGEWWCDGTEACWVKRPANKLEQIVPLQLCVKPLLS